MTINACRATEQLKPGGAPARAPHASRALGPCRWRRACTPSHAPSCASCSPSRPPSAGGTAHTARCVGSCLHGPLAVSPRTMLPWLCMAAVRVRQQTPIGSAAHMQRAACTHSCGCWPRTAFAAATVSCETAAHPRLPPVRRCGGWYGWRTATARRSTTQVRPVIFRVLAREHAAAAICCAE